MSRQTQDGDRPAPALRARRGGGPAEFAAVDNQIHFHPDPGLGLAILVLHRRSALRPAGVHLLDPTSRRWWRWADLDELRLGSWVRPRDERGRPVPVEVLRAGPATCVRWLDEGGRPVPPSTWDRARVAAARAALAGSCPA